MARTQQAAPAVRRILRVRKVCERTGLSRSTVYKMSEAGQEVTGALPRALQLGPRAVGWYEDEVAAWIESRQRRAV